MTGHTPDISEYSEYKLYDTIWYYDQQATFPRDKHKLAKWLGVAHRVRQALQIESHITIADRRVFFETPGLQDTYEPYEPEAEIPEVADFTTKMYDALISAEVVLPEGDTLVPATVIGHKHDSDGNPTGTSNSNPILDSRIYQVRFPDGHLEDYSTNFIAKNIYSQVDAEDI